MPAREKGAALRYRPPHSLGTTENQSLLAIKADRVGRGRFPENKLLFAAVHILKVSLQRVIKAAASAYGRAGLRGGGESCERMPNQLKPKKLDLPHLHPCSHRLQKTLQGRFGKARHTAARRTQSQPGNRQGCVAVSVKGERGHFRVAAFTLSNADLYQHGSLHRAKQSDLGILNLPSPK